VVHKLHVGFKSTITVYRKHSGLLTRKTHWYAVIPVPCVTKQT